VENLTTSCFHCGKEKQVTCFPHAPVEIKGSRFAAWISMDPGFFLDLLITFISILQWKQRGYISTPHMISIPAHPTPLNTRG
jgi:hypothetical protein